MIMPSAAAARPRGSTHLQTARAKPATKTRTQTSSATRAQTSSATRAQPLREIPATTKGAKISLASANYQQMRAAAERRSSPSDRSVSPPGISAEQQASVLREVSEGYAAIASMREATMRRRAQIAQLRSAIAGEEAARPFSEVALSRLPKVRTAAGYATLRALLRDHGVDRLRDELAEKGLVGDDGLLTTGTKPFNLFARLGSGAMVQPEMQPANAALAALTPEAAERYVLCCNRPENDAHWASDAPEWLGKASMSQRHRFMTVRTLEWTYFNALTLGIRGGEELRRAIETLEEMRAVAHAFTLRLGLGLGLGIGLGLGRGRGRGLGPGLGLGLGLGLG